MEELVAFCQWAARSEIDAPGGGDAPRNVWECVRR
jgi:hypothetical protein